MTRTPLIFVAVLIALIWQSFALARIDLEVIATSDAHHAALHWQEIPHHHHADGSSHIDDSKASTHHVCADHFCVPPILVMTYEHHFPNLGAGTYAGPPEIQLPDPDPHGLLRPPRTLS